MPAPGGTSRDSKDGLAPRRGGLLRRLAAGLLGRAARAPLTTGALTLVLAVNLAIVVNALALQRGRHPAPLFGTGLTSRPEAAALKSEKRTRGVERANASPAPASGPAAPNGDPIVRAVQAELGARGFHDGRADGLLGPKTEAAIRQFERMARLPESGRPSARLIEAIRKSDLKIEEEMPAQRPAPTDPETRLVSSVQKLLADLGYAPGPIDGRLTKATRKAIERFELDRGLPASGVITERLLRELAVVTGLPVG